jgi:hypothetical protein
MDPLVVGGFSRTVLGLVLMASAGKAETMSRFEAWTRTVASRMRGEKRDAGAGFVEYAGLMIIIAGIFTMIDGLGLDGAISGAIMTAVNNVIGGG